MDMVVNYNPGYFEKTFRVNRLTKIVAQTQGFRKSLLSFWIFLGSKSSVTKGPHGGGVKKAKSKKELTLQKFKKEVRKGINAHIEQQVSSKAKQVEDRTFHCAELNPATKKGNKK